MFLQIDDICDLGCVNKEWEKLLNDSSLWKSISDHRGIVI
jgi:hypothetical protein